MNADLLHHELVTAEGTRPRQWLLVLHGLLGWGRNWLSVARRLVETRPDWGAVLVDLPEHGPSQRLPGPHTLKAAADHLRRLVEAKDWPAPAVLGHSFGGKVALAYAGAARETRQPLAAAFIVDSTPAKRQHAGEAADMLEILSRLSKRFDSRQQAIDALQSAGLSAAVAQWMAANLVRDDAAWRWRFRIEVIRSLHEDFLQRELWGVLEAPVSTSFHFLRATRGNLMDPPTAARLIALGNHVRLHEVTGGHWLNVDNPEAVVRLVADHLPR